MHHDSIDPQHERSYQVLAGPKATSAAEAIRLLLPSVQDALRSGCELVGGVTVTYGAILPWNHKPGYEAFQAVLN